LPRRKLIGLLVAVACLALLGWTLQKLGPQRVVDTALRADPLWLTLSVLPILLRFLVWGHKWTRMLRRERPVPLWLAIRILAVGSFVNLTTPTAKVAGGIVRAALLHRRRGWRMSTAYGWALADQITNVLGNLLLVGVLAVGVGLTVPDVEYRSAFVVPGLLAVLAVIAVAALRGGVWEWAQRPEVGRRLVSIIPRRFRGQSASSISADRLGRIFGPLLHHGSALRTFLPDVLWASLAFGAVLLANALVLRSLGVEASLLLISVAVALGYFAGVVVGVWGGIGVTEAALTGLYVQLGIPGDQAAAAALLHRAIFYVIVLSCGGLSLLQFGRTARVAPAE
jgi:uncharacterized protein (TIRG00374 family)